jgi:type 1 glutamine amidotransferase
MNRFTIAVVLIAAAELLTRPLTGQVSPAPGGPRAGQRQAPQGPPPGSASAKPSGSSLGRIRLGAADPLWFRWNIGIPATAFRELTFLDAAVKADALGLGSIEGFSNQKVSLEIPKNLDYRLAPGERTAILGRLRELNVKMPAYHLDAIPADDASRRKLFEFAKAMGVDTIVTSAGESSLADLDKLASEFEINVALAGNALPALAARSKRIGVSANIGSWMEKGVKPSDGLAQVKDRLMAVTVRPTGSGAAQLPDFFLQAYRLELKPLFISVDAAGSADPFADLSKSVDALERALQPAMIARVRQTIDSPAGAIRGPDRLPAEMRQQIEAAIPDHAPAKPRKPRKLLVVDLNMYSGHTTIPHGNLLLDLLGKKTGAYEPVFSNDLNNLKYPKVKEYDAVFLNSVVGMVFPDPEVRDGLMRFVREGGGLGGVHGTTYAALDWPEFTDMLGGSAGEHHVETQVLKIDDPDSPLTKAFAGKGLEHTDEFYHFPASSPYSREKEHVLISIDVEKSDLATSGRLCAKCTRPDHDYAMSWIRSYGIGRVFCTPIGHTPILFTSRPWVEHLFAGVQFILGDLDADTTPSAKLAAKRQK